MDLKMEIYTPSLELVGILEVHRSVIWEEKAFGAGSFSVDALITPESKTLLVPGNIVWITDNYAGIIEYVQERSGKDGPYITVKGPDLTGILGQRILWGQYNLTGTPPAIMHSLVNDCCISPSRGDVEARKIPGLVLENAPPVPDPIEQTLNITVSDDYNSAGIMINTVGTLTIDGNPIKTEQSTINTTSTTIKISYVLNNTISKPRTFVVNGNIIKTVSASGDKAETTIPVTENILVNFSSSSVSKQIEGEADKNTISSIRYQKTGGTLLDALEELGAAFSVAFGVRFNPAVPQMEFWTRWGQNRSVSQNINAPVFYSTELDDVLSSEYSYNAQDWRNVALVAGEGEGGNRVMVTVEADVQPAPMPPTPPEPTKYTITLSVDPQGGGVASGGGQVSEGRSVTVTASPSSGYTFSGWRENGAVVSTSASYTFTASADRSLTAVFAAVVPTYTITATIDPAGAGTVAGAGQYQEGASVTLTAAMNDGYKFTGWQENGQTVSTDNPYTFTATADRTFTAVFAEASRLPEGYTELQYISTDGYARIPTGIRATIDTTRVVMDVIPTEHRDVRAYFFDALNYYSSNFTYGFGLRNNETAGSMNWFSGYWGNSSGGYASFNYSFNYGQRVTIDMDCPTEKLKIGNTSISISPATTTSVKDAGDLNFGGYYPTDNAAFTQRMNIYSAQVYLAGVLKGDFVPCVKDDGTIGLYNLVDHVFYGASHGTLTAGPAV